MLTIQRAIEAVNVIAVAHHERQAITARTETAAGSNRARNTHTV
jgi:hypothetical protein